MTDSVSPLFLFLILVGGLIILFGPRRMVLPVFLTLSVFLSMDFHIIVFGLNFFTIRILLAIAWARILMRGEYRGLKRGSFDTAFIVFCVWMVFAETLQREFAGFVYAAANNFVDGLGIYFLGRIFMSEVADLKRIIVSLGAICSVLAAFMLAEALTRHNWLTSLGAVMQNVQVRAGRMRCQATFLHPVLAGTFGAVLLPIFAALWWQGGAMKRLAIVGCLASTVMTITAGSGGPVMTYMAVVGAFCLWPIRHHMRRFRWTMVISLIVLQIAMKAPVWALIARIQVVHGASAYHRYVLLDAFIRHFSDWWLIGTQTTGDWGYLTDDVANTYCILAKHGGLLALILFGRLLVLAFREVGTRRAEAENDVPTQILIWAFGACLFGHLISFLGTSYFDQTRALWFLTLAMFPILGLLVQTKAEEDIVAQTVPFQDAVEAPQGTSWV